MRKQRYSSDPAYADEQRRQSRQNYRKSNPLGTPKSTGALAAAGQMREVFVDGMDDPATVEAFTLPEAARALGRSELTLKRWIEDDLVPEPILRDTVRGYRLYSVGELRVIAQVLLDHEREYAYYRTEHELTKHRLMQQMQGYRAISI